MANPAHGGVGRYRGFTGDSPNDSTPDGIDDTRLVALETHGGWGNSLTSPATPMAAPPLATEIAPASVGNDARVASVALDFVSAPMSLPAEPAAAGDATPLAQQDTSLIRLDQMRADLRFNWLDGRGLSVAVIDSGINLNHPFFGNRIVYQHDYYYDDPYAVDWTGHGSNVSSIIGSQDGTYTGMAPGVNIIALKVFPDNPGQPSIRISRQP